MELRQIKDLIKTVDSTSTVELEIEKEGCRIRAKKDHSPVQLVQPQNQPTVSNIEETNLEQDGAYIKIPSPMVGTFYRAPAPDVASYVQVGDIIDEG